MIENNSLKKPMKFNVKAHLLDLLKFKNLVKTRRKKIAKASTTPIQPPFINILSNRLHPTKQHMIVNEIRTETPSTKTFRLIPDKMAGSEECAYFRAGQYLSVKLNIDGITVTRPYSIASSPSDALRGYYELTIKKVPDGFVTPYIWENWKQGTKVEVSEPLGFMYHESLRDTSSIVGIAGGSGVVPFRSILREIQSGGLDISLNLLYGCSNESDMLYYEELNSFAEKIQEKFKVTYVMSSENVQLDGCETGFITSEIIQKYTDPTKDTYFVCGPALMYDFVSNELDELKIPLKRIRKEAYGEVKDPKRFPTYPENLDKNEFRIVVNDRGNIHEISAKSNESVLVALERARYVIPSACRSGECQFCRTILTKGDIWVSPMCDGRRKADIQYGYFHPCSSFPLSDLEIILPQSK